MRLARRLWLRLQTLIRRKEIARRLDDEVQFHVARRVHWSSENHRSRQSRDAEESRKKSCLRSCSLIAYS